MVIGDRLKQIRESKNMSQGVIEKRTGLFRCYISRCENNHSVPTIETLEKMARALEVPLYAIFYDGDEQPPIPKICLNDGGGWGSKPADARTLDRFRRLLARTKPSDRQLLLLIASKMAGRKKRKGARTKV